MEPSSIPTPDSQATPPELTVYFDGSCPLCAWEIERYQTCAGAEKIAWVDASRTGHAAIADDLTAADALRRLHVRRADGSLVAGAGAFVAVWSKLQGWRWLAPVASRPLVIRTLDWLYAGFLKVRPGVQWLFRVGQRRPRG